MPGFQQEILKAKSQVPSMRTGGLECYGMNKSARLGRTGRSGVAGRSGVVGRLGGAGRSEGAGRSGGVGRSEGAGFKLQTSSHHACDLAQLTLAGICQSQSGFSGSSLVTQNPYKIAPEDRL